MRVESLALDGSGRASDGTLVPRSLPGEDVELAPDGSLRILTPSPDRVAPPCRHYRACGGCSMQHAADDFVAGWKTSVVARALAARGVEAEISGVVTSPPLSRRRAKLAGRRTKKGALVGFHARASDTIVEIPGCQILLPSLTALLPALEAITALAASRKGEVGLTITDSTEGPDLLIEVARELTPELRADLPALAARYGLARVTWNAEPVAELQAPTQRFGRARVVPPPGAFLQATRDGEAALLAHVLDGTTGARRVADLFAGCGTFALPLSERAEVHAVEGEAAMLSALDRGWRGTAGLHRVTTEARDLYRRPLLSDELAGFDAVVLDPPRAGADAQVAAIAKGGPPTVVMVSCNPVTFARDAATLVGASYRAEPVTVVDQFRWSSHVELVSRFTRS